MPAPQAITTHEPLLVNTIGHSAGTLVFALSLYFLRRGGRERRPGIRLSMFAAALALIWNLASLLVLAVRESGWPGQEALVAISTSALSLLPAVLLHLSLGGRFVWIVRSGYVLGAAAVLLHVAEHAVENSITHRDALAAATLGFGALTLLTAAALVARGGDRRLTSRLAGAMALFLFSMSLVHAGSVEPHGNWTLEVLLHHGGVLVALVVLLQDYRFVLLDAFLRVLASIALAGVLLGAGLWWTGVTIPGRTPFRQGVALVAAALLLAGYATLRHHLQEFLTRIVFGRRNLAPALEQLRDLAARHRGNESAFLEAAGAAIAGFLQAEIVPPAEAEAVVAIRRGPGETYRLALGHRAGGRRYLSEDLQAAGRLAAEASQHIEQERAAEMRRLVAQAELRALESQIQPHFLFNVLNTLYGLIPRHAASARETLLNLSDILRYSLRQDRTYTTLDDELRIVEAYLAIEKVRLGERLHTRMEIDAAARAVSIPVLSLEPLVENAVKHGIAARQEGGEIAVIARVESGALLIRVEDTGPGFGDAAAGGTGVGLANVRRRLELCYGAASSLAVTTSPAGSAVEFRVPMGAEAAA